MDSQASLATLGWPGSLQTKVCCPCQDLFDIKVYWVKVLLACSYLVIN